MTVASYVPPSGLGISRSLPPQVLYTLEANENVAMQDEKMASDMPCSSDEKSGGLMADPPVRGLVYHAVLYLGVVLILLAVNLRFTPDALWVQWIALLWGILLVWNAWKVLSAR